MSALPAAASRRLLNIIAGFLAPTRGEIRIGGRPVTGHGLDRGVVFQDFAQLFPWRTALGNVTFGLEMKGVGRAEREEIALQAARARQARKVRAILSAPFIRWNAAAGRHCAGACLQSFGAADGRAVRGTRCADQRRDAAALADVWRETRKTVVYVTHNVAEAVYLADRVVVMTPHPGKVKADVRIDLARPRNPLSVEFLEHQKMLLHHLGRVRRCRAD